jgi:hypothetical protein
MRRVLVAVLLAASLAFAASDAVAADGCSYGYDGHLYCQPGARPGVPYGWQGPYQDRYYGQPYYGHRYQRGYDPGPAIAAGVIGAIGTAIISQQRYHRRAKHRRR